MIQAPALIACDAMLGGLARWLRAAGHDAAWTYGIEDRALVEFARREGRILLSSDGPLCRAILADGLPPPSGRPSPAGSPGPGPYPRSLFVPRGLRTAEQLHYVLSRLGLPRLDPRCMPCGGILDHAPIEEARAKVPEWIFHNAQGFYRCTACGKIYWKGTHWKRIDEALERLTASGKGSP